MMVIKCKLWKREGKSSNHQQMQKWQREQLERERDGLPLPWWCGLALRRWRTKRHDLGISYIRMKFDFLVCFVFLDFLVITFLAISSA